MATTGDDSKESKDENEILKWKDECVLYQKAFDQVWPDKSKFNIDSFEELASLYESEKDFYQDNNISGPTERKHVRPLVGKLKPLWGMY